MLVNPLSKIITVENNYSEHKKNSLENGQSNKNSDHSLRRLFLSTNIKQNKKGDVRIVIRPLSNKFLEINIKRRE